MQANEQSQQLVNMIYGIDVDYLQQEEKKIQKINQEELHTYRSVFYEYFKDIQTEYMEEGLSPRTLADIESIIRNYVLREGLPYDTIADEFVELLKVNDIKKMKKNILSIYKHLSHKYLSKIFIFIDKVFSYAADQGYISRQTVLDIKLTKIGGKQQRRKNAVRNFLSEKEFQVFESTFESNAIDYFKWNLSIRISKFGVTTNDVNSIPVFRSLLYKAFFNFIFYVGTRKNETRGIKWKDIIEPSDNFPLHSVLIDKQFCDKSSKYVNKKGHDRRTKSDSGERICVIHKNCIAALNELRKFLIVYGLYDENKAIFYDFYVKEPKPIPETNLDRCWRYILDLTEIEKNSIIIDHTKRHITIHGMRHSACTMLLEKGMDKLSVAKFLGHKDTEMVDYVYNHFISPRDTEQSKLAQSIAFFM